MGWCTASEYKCKLLLYKSDFLGGITGVFRGLDFFFLTLRAKSDSMPGVDLTKFSCLTSWAFGGGTTGTTGPTCYWESYG